MVITIQQLLEQYSNYADPKGKISRDVKNGKLFPIVRGLYEAEKNTAGEKLAQFIYGPSYLSFDYALYKYDLIPEAVYTYTCATFNKRKRKMYTNQFGAFIYQDVPKEVFSFGVKYVKDGNYSYQIASPEKAICDKLYTLSPVKSIKNLKILLFEDLRTDEYDFEKLDKNEILKFAPLYKSTNLNLLAKLVKGDK